MQIPMVDGPPAEVSVLEYAELIKMGLVSAPVAPKPVTPKTRAELLREALDMPKDPPIEPQEIVGETNEDGVTDVEPDPPTPAKLPKHVGTKPIVFLTIPQDVMIGALRHHPEGLTNKELAEKLRWTMTKTSSQMSRLLKEEAVFSKQILTKVRGKRVYHMTPFGLTGCQYKVTGQPARFRHLREPDRFTAP